MSHQLQPWSDSVRATRRQFNEDCQQQQRHYKDPNLWKAAPSQPWQLIISIKHHNQGCTREAFVKLFRDYRGAELKNDTLTDPADISVQKSAKMWKHWVILLGVKTCLSVFSVQIIWHSATLRGVCHVPKFLYIKCYILGPRSLGTMKCTFICMWGFPSQSSDEQVSRVVPWMQLRRRGAYEFIKVAGNWGQRLMHW